MNAPEAIYDIDGSKSQEQATLYDDFDETKSPYIVSNFRPLSDFEQVNGKWREKVIVPANDDDGEIRLWTLDEIYAEPDPVWLIEDILQEASFNILSGLPGSKKSFIAQDIGASVALGLPWLDQRVTQGDVVYIYAEGRKGLKFRAMAWDESRGETPRRMRIIDRAIDIPNLRSIKKLVKAIRAQGLNPVLIIIDTMARNFGEGDENKTPDMNAFIKGVDALQSSFDNCSVLVVHHTGWDGKHERGSSALRGAVDTSIKAVSGAKTKTGYIDFLKIKDGDTERFGRPEFTLIPTKKSVVLEWSTGVAGPDEVPLKQGPVTPKLTPNQQKILLQFRSPNSKYRNGELQKATGVSPSTLSEALKVLTSQGYIAKADDGKGYVLLSKITPISKRKSK